MAPETIARHQVMARNGLAINVMLFVLLRDVGILAFVPVMAVICAYLADFLCDTVPKAALYFAVFAMVLTVASFLSSFSKMMGYF